MKKPILTLSLILTVITIVFSQQRMRLSRGSFNLSKTTTKIPANCIDRAADIPLLSNKFEITTNSIILVGNSVPQMGLDEAIQKGIIEITGNGTSTGVNINMLKPQLGYDKIVVKNSFGVLGAKGQNFDDLNKLKELEAKMKIVDKKSTQLLTKYNKDHPINQFYDKEKYAIEGMFTKQFYSKEKIKAKIDNLIRNTIKKEKVYDLIHGKNYVFFNRYNMDYSTLKNKTIIVENPNNLSSRDITKIIRYNKNPFIISEDALFKNITKPKEKLKFIIVGSDDAATNKKLYEALSEDQMQSFTNSVKKIKSNPELSPFFEFVSSKSALEQSLKNNQQFRTITLYHNRSDDLLFGELKSSFPTQDRLTCNSFKEGSWGSTIESIDFIDPEDVINTYANLIKNNSNKNEFQIIDFYEKFSKYYGSIRRKRNQLLAGKTIIAITGTTGIGTMIWYFPTGNISGKVISNESIGLDSIEINLLDWYGKIVATTTTSNGEFSFKGIVADEYYLEIDGYVDIVDAKDETPEDNRDAKLVYGKYIYVNLEPQESDQNNNFKINKN